MSMAPKRRNEEPLEEKAHSSSDEEGSEEDEEESSSEDTTTPPPPTNPKPASQKPQSSSSADSGSDSDSDAPTNTRAVAAVAPPPAKHVVKPAEKSASKNSRSKPPSTPVKRPAEPQSEKKDSKRVKKGDGASSEKARPRIWSDEDEISVLKGMIEFQVKNGFSANSNFNAFYDYIKKALRGDLSKTQVSDKVRHLKTKYLTTLEKQKTENGNVSVLKPRDKQLFDLSHNVWGETNGIHSEEPKEPKSIKKAKKIKNDGSNTPHPRKPEIKNDGSTTPHPHKPEIKKPVEAPKDVPPPMVEIPSSGNYSEIQDYVLEKGLDLLEESDRAEFEKRCAQLRKAEMEVYVEKCDLLYKQAKLLLEAYK